MSSGLKRIIGRELITDDEVAIFELVKNSFDANAKNVSVLFTQEQIIILDDGDGMTREDVRDKWLFVAYSSKKEESIGEASQDFREQVQDRKHYAGSKGIGRFSCDRLGRNLLLQSRPKKPAGSPVHRITVNWDLFEADETKQFSSIPVEYEDSPQFDLERPLKAPKHGTALIITNLRAEWNRSRLLHLRASLAKLINPFGASTDGFTIEIVAPFEKSRDRELIEKAKRNADEPAPNSIVNGEVGNFVFGALREKTTYIDVAFDEDGQNIISTLIDRGELIYQIREPQPFAHIKNSGFRCELYYLNQSAKLTFTRRMGLPPIQFGSVFLFRNGFRVFPIGEQDDDWFGIDRRKQQGYARFLGTRDIIGRIDVSGSESDFKEASSRNQGLIETPAEREMTECFWEYCLKRLERYVVPVTWADKGEKHVDDLSRLLTDSGKARVTASVARLIDNADVEVLDYSRRLIQLLNERSAEFEDSLVSLRSIAAKTQDRRLLANIDKAERRFEELKRAEAQAIRIAEEERAAKEAAQERAAAAEELAEQAGAELEEEKKRNLFLSSIGTLDTQTILSMHHQITIYAADMKQQIENCLIAATSRNLSAADLRSRLEQVAFLNQKVLAISKLATKSNFRLESDTIEADLGNFLEEYVKEGAAPFISGGMDITLKNSAGEFIKRFRPMEIAVVVDNLVSNSRKAGASEIRFEITAPDKTSLTIEVCDDGRGLPKMDDAEQLFELGFTRTAGSGLGLYHVRQVLGQLGGSIVALPRSTEGACFQMRIAK